MNTEQETKKQGKPETDYTPMDLIDFATRYINADEETKKAVETILNS